MAKTVSIGNQDFASIRERDCFYVDKTGFIRQWWDSEDSVTLITRPRRFGKTLNMSMLNYFFSNRYEGRGDLFEGLDIWKEERFRKLQGSLPVIFLTFAGVKGRNYAETVGLIKRQLDRCFDQYDYFRNMTGLSDDDMAKVRRIGIDMSDEDAEMSLNLLCSLLEKYYGRKALILLDEYDTPMQEAYVGGYWDELAAFIRALFNNTFKTNLSMSRAIMTGITRVSKESIFSDLNNLNVVTTTSRQYETVFGFTEDEVFAAMDEQGIPDEEKEHVKFWYDGFTFGKTRDIYNPWSVTMFLDTRDYKLHWANTSGNGLVGKLIREGDRGVKTEFEKLLNGENIEAEIDEQIIFDQLSRRREAIWSLLLASGYLKVESVERATRNDRPVYRLSLTNYEVKMMFEDIIHEWFDEDSSFSDFISSMLRGDEYEMNAYMNEVALNTFSSFDTGNRPSRRREPERFYHGFVLGLMVDKAKDYIVNSNRESGLGRYDVVMEPKDVSNPANPAVIMEFKVRDEKRGEKNLEDTAQNALKQIEDKKYAADLVRRGIPEDRILKYGFAFEGEECLILKG